jgi:hypothetical protein
MPEIRETHVERDAEGRVVDTKVTIDRPRRRGGGFGWGMLLGVILIAGAIIAFAYSQGSFQQAGVQADQAKSQVEQATGEAIDKTGAAIDQRSEDASRAANETSDTATY